MKLGNVLRTKWRLLVLAALTAFPDVSHAASLLSTRKPDEDVKSPSVRIRSGLRPGNNLLFNGWGVTPAGEQVMISDMTLKFVVSPDKKMLLAASGGFNDTGLTLFNLADRRVTQFILRAN